jgi:subtilase family serine protease
MKNRNTAFKRSLFGLVAAGLLANSGVADAWTDTVSKGFPFNGSVALSDVAATQPLNIVVTLKLRNQDELKTYLADQHHAGHPSYGTTLTPAAFAARYAPTAEQAQAVANYLNGSGFTNVKIEKGRTLIRAQATAAVAQKAFNATLKGFSAQGQQHFINTSALRVPDSLGNLVLSVSGMNDISVAHVNHQIKPKTSAVPSAGGVPALNLSYNAAQYQAAYNAGTTPTGANTSLAIVSAGSDLTQVVADLRQFETLNSLPVVPVRIVNVTTPGTDTSGDGEWALDSQSSSGIAGDLKEIVFYNTATLGDSDLLLAYNQFVADGTSKIGNMSFGGCEILNVLLGSTDAANQAYMQAIAQGQTWFASSGDAGASCTVLVNLGLPDSGPISVESPASSPYVVAVGGTTLLTNTDYSYNSELSWDAGGGGTSVYETAPDWQTSIAPLAAAGLRAVPDIAMDADPNTGAEIVVDGAVNYYGGTSLSSPLSAGVWARIQSAHCNQYGFAAPMIYALDTAGIPLSTATGFHDVLIGTNGLWVATPGWDYTTGFGSFDITAVNAALPAVTCPVESTTGSTGGDTGTGTGGGTAAGAPTATLSATPTSGTSPLQVAFDASASKSADGSAVTYTFLFGDGSDPVNSSSPTLSYTYPAAGTFAAQIVVTDAHGNTASSSTVTIKSTASVTVTGSDHAVAAMIVSPTSGSIPLTVTFDGSRSFGANGNAISSYTWDFGDGASAVTTTSATTTHVYTKVGTFSPTLSVSDSSGNVSPDKAMAAVKVGSASGSSSSGSADSGSSGGGGGAFGASTLGLLSLMGLARRRYRGKAA